MRSHGSTWPLLVASLLAASACGVATGKPVTEPASPALRRVEAPTVAFEQAALAAIPGMRSDAVELAVALPPALNPAEEHPILITQVTSGSGRSNIDGVSAYVAAALALDYVVLTAQGSPWPASERSDTLAHRYGSVRAALRWLASEVPASEGWPIVLAGFSGGAKISQALAFSLSLEGRQVAGMYLGGCNEDHSRVLLGEFPAMKERFSRTAVFLSVGEDDRIAPPDAVREVAEHMRRSGVERLKLSLHRGGHQLNAQTLTEALGWLRPRPREPGGP